MGKKIVLCTLRDNKGATGGPGGVLFMLSKNLGTNVNGIHCVYRFNAIKRDFRFKNIINKTIFRLRCLIDNDVVYYVTHDIESAAILSDMKKPYSLVYHNQGPIVLEQLNFGTPLSSDQIVFGQEMERKAFTGAKTLHFPSSGAAEMYFNNQYASCSKDEVCMAEPMYNTIPESDIKPIFNLKEDHKVLTFFSLGTLTKAKGQDQSMQFIEAFLKANMSIKVRYIVVGRGPLQKEICEKGETLMNMYDNFTFLYYDSLTHSEVMYIHKISDVYLMLHRLSIFDFATLEAMSLHTALVLSSVGGNIDFNKNHNVIFASGDYSDAISKLSIRMIDEMKERNYSVFNDYFSSNAFADAYRQMIIANIFDLEDKIAPPSNL